MDPQREIVRAERFVPRNRKHLIIRQRSLHSKHALPTVALNETATVPNETTRANDLTESTTHMRVLTHDPFTEPMKTSGERRGARLRAIDG